VKKNPLLALLAKVGVALSLGLGAVGSSQAILITGAWDPVYGAPFDQGPEVLGWRGTVTFDVPDACVVAGLVTTSTCAGMRLEEAQVVFYDVATEATVDTLDYEPGDLGFFSILFGTAGEVLSLTSSFFAPQQPDSSFANINYYGFQLQFVEAGARMYHSLDLAFWSDSKLVTVDPKYCYKWIPGFVCGYSGTYSDGSPTAPAVFVEFKVVPEPSSIWLLLAAGVAGGMLLRRRPARRLTAAA
jgi:hypothetical protein